MSKVRVFEYNGKYIQHQYWCLGCGYEHAFNIKIHTFNGDLNNPTITPSLLQNFTPDRICHSYIANGKITYLDDCWHTLKGESIELPDIDKILEDKEVMKEEKNKFGK